jgi:cell division protein ZapA
MSDEGFISINVWLAGRSYRIRIKQDEEEAVRKAVKIADSRVQEMRNSYAGKDDQDFIAMCLLAYAADHALDAGNDPLLQETLKDFSRRIDNALTKE